MSRNRKNQSESTCYQASSERGGNPLATRLNSRDPENVVAGQPTETMDC